MITAAADYADGKCQPPDALRLAFQCKMWGALPKAGGLLDQPAGLIEKMTTCQNTYNAWRNWKAAIKSGKQADFDPHQLRIVRAVQKARDGTV